jgi:hypothetical protein
MARGRRGREDGAPHGLVRRIVLGSVSSKVIRAVACPVVVIPRRMPDGFADPDERFIVAGDEALGSW